MTFGIPLSSSSLVDDSHNQCIYLPEYAFVHADPRYNIPMRAIISQATRVDGNVFNQARLIGNITDLSVRGKIENKLFDWLFK